MTKNINSLPDILRDIVGNANVLIDELMKRHTSFRIGGPADIMVKPRTAEQITSILKACSKVEVLPFVMGNGTNILVGSKGIRGVVVKLCEGFGTFSVNGNEILASAGVLLSRIAKVAYDNSLAGMEFAAGIPGSIGGAVVMNAGAYGSDMKNITIRTEYVDLRGETEGIVDSTDAHKFGYRKSVFSETGWIVLKTILKLNEAPKESIRELMEDLAQRRKSSQPLEYPSAGSIFKRPEGHYVGKMVEECGLKGFTIGGAQISGKHCGFIINKEHATASDVLRLIDYVKNEVRSRFGVELETEVCMVGEE